MSSVNVTGGAEWRRYLSSSFQGAESNTIYLGVTDHVAVPVDMATVIGLNFCRVIPINAQRLTTWLDG